ncbi:acrB/AcrD/AcrF family protein, partial [Vibrio parahaemolyticus V-223/04]|jgi:hypothetical protein
LKR